MEKRHSTPHIRHERIRYLKRKANIIKNVYHDDLWKNIGHLSKGKVHCSCPMCASKTNSKKLTGYTNNWKISDKKKIESMNSSFEEYMSCSSSE